MRLEKETAAGWAPSPAGVTSLVGSRWDGGILFPPRDRRKSWSDRLCDHVPDTSPEARRGAGREDQRRAPGIGLSEQERVVPGQSVSGRLGVGGRRFCAGTTGPAGRRPGDAVVASRTLGGRSLSIFVRSLRHVKLVYRPGEPLEAKAYLAGNHLWHTPASRSSLVRPQ